MDSMGRSVQRYDTNDTDKVTIHFHEPVHHDHATRVAIMAARRAAGLDLWTGEATPNQTYKDDDE